MSFISSFEIIEVVVPEPYIFLWIHVKIAEAAAVIPNGTKTCFAKGIATFINGPANLRNNDPKNPLDWTILEMWALQNFKSVDILLLNALLSFVFCLVVSNNSCGRSFPSNIYKLIHRVVPVLFLTAVFSLFSCVSVNFAFTLLYSTICTNYKTLAVHFAKSSIASFGCSRIVDSLIFVPSSLPTTPWNTTCWIDLGSASKAFCLLKSTAINL